LPRCCGGKNNAGKPALIRNQSVMNSVQRKRVHLSTVLVVLMLASVLVLLNVTGRLDTAPVDDDYCTVVKRGWPLSYHYTVYHRTGRYTGVRWYYGSLAKDIALAVVVLGAEGAAWEWLMRMRDRRAHGA